MGKESGNDLIPIISATDLCDRLMTGIDFDIRVIGTGTIGVLWVPVVAMGIFSSLSGYFLALRSKNRLQNGIFKGLTVFFVSRCLTDNGT